MKQSVVLFLMILMPLVGFGTHMRGGQIQVFPQANSLTCKIRITAYTNTNSEIRFGEGRLDFGDGTDQTTPRVENTARPDIFQGLGFVTYSVLHTYAEAGPYLITYEEPNLNGGIINIQNSVETRFYIETFIVIGADSSFASPEFPLEPIFIFEMGLNYTFSTAAIDNSPGEFYYKYSLVTNPKMIKVFELPSTLSINKYNGMIKWDTKYHGQYAAGEFWILVKIDKYTNEGDHLGYVERAMQIIVEDGTADIDVTSSVDDTNNKIVVTEDSERVVKVLLSDGVNGDHNLDLQMFVSDKIKDNVSITEYDSVSGDMHGRAAKLTFNTTADIVSNMPYSILLRGKSKDLRKDISFLYMTKDMLLPTQLPVSDGPEVVTAVKDELVRQLNVYPNPFSTELYVEGGEVIFINTLGQVVMRSTLQKSEPVNTSTLPMGFYVVKIVGEDGVMRSVKVVRE